MHDLLRDDLRRETQLNKALSAEIQVLIALRYYATGGFMQVVGDTFGVDKSAVSRVVHSISTGRLLNLVARWPGSIHDSRIFRKPLIGRQFETLPGQGVLLGDAAIPCRPFLMTPYPNPQNRQQERFNAAHVKTRSIIERTFEIWKRRFHILHSEIRVSPETVCSVIGACAVLHKIAIMMKEPVIEGDDNVEDIDNTPLPLNEYGRGIREFIANTYFS